MERQNQNLENRLGPLRARGNYILTGSRYLVRYDDEVAVDVNGGGGSNGEVATWRTRRTVRGGFQPGLGALINYTIWAYRIGWNEPRVIYEAEAFIREGTPVGIPRIIETGEVIVPINGGERRIFRIGK